MATVSWTNVNSNITKISLILLEGFEYENAMAVSQLASNVMSDADEYSFSWPDTVNTGNSYWLLAQGNDLSLSKAVFGAFTFVDPAIIGAAVGGAAYLAIVALLLWRFYVFYKKRKQSKYEFSDDSTLKPSSCNDDKKSMQSSAPSSPSSSSSPKQASTPPPRSPMLNSPTPSTLPPPFSPVIAPFAFNPYLYPRELHAPYASDDKSHLQYIYPPPPPLSPAPSAKAASAPPETAFLPYFSTTALIAPYPIVQLGKPTENAHLAKTESEEGRQEIQKPHAVS
ncbi:hypothetical protein EC973_009291 [Apophysomyces ossiformis]|uniref:Yeast cell wall synthesis Kre9/Knh1-like N-terminal domain-containing protein n=1 Tax=Apophysomyces ossiformis TaxID=679940 RepID=A0A8H7BUX8_9FUNG|nr:hypothetical protein EC973_009291 [Apophysomyces ossiformis]